MDTRKNKTEIRKNNVERVKARVREKLKERQVVTKFR